MNESECPGCQSRRDCFGSFFRDFLLNRSSLCIGEEEDGLSFMLFIQLYFHLQLLLVLRVAKSGEGFDVIERI